MNDLLNGSTLTSPLTRPRTQPGGGGPGPKTTENRSRNVRTSDGYERQGDVGQSGGRIGVPYKNPSTVLVDGLDVQEVSVSSFVVAPSELGF
jgi:hypothetical protein